MNHALLSRETESSQASKVNVASNGLRVSRPGDSFELEAERVAETVSSGRRIPGWSIATSGFGGIQRQSAPPDQQPAPQPNNYGDILSKLADAFLKTKAGQDAVKLVTGDPMVKASTDFVSTPGGVVVAGAAAGGVISALAAAHKPLPAQIPQLPLDFVYPGLKVKITYQGPVDRPTLAMLTLSYSGKAPEKKSKQTETERNRAETARIAADQDKFRAGMKYAPGSPQDLQQKAEKKTLDDWILHRFGTIPGVGDKPLIPATQTPAATTTPDTGLRLPTFESPFKSKTHSLLDQKLELKPLTLTSPAQQINADDKKREEIPVQRKAESCAEVFADSGDVDAVLRSSGRPLDRETRRFMESRFGFDFGKVRLHTDARAAVSARSMGARAYTVGSDVVFGAGRYAPQTTEGRRLLAHELTHVVQQSGSEQRAHPVVRPAPRQVQRFLGLPDAKKWLLDKLHDLKGYPLFCVVIGQDLATGEKVERNATNLTQGVLGLFDGGPALFERLKKAASALDTAYQWVLGEINQLGLTVKYFSDLLDKALAAVNVHLIDSWERVKAILKEPLDKLIELASRLAKAALDFILEAALEVFPAGKKVYGILKKAGSVISRIAADPISFGKNLFAAVQQGFKNFGDNILKHLGDGLKRWIFEEIDLPDLKMPEKFDFASILNLVLQVLKLTYEQRRPQLVEKLGEQAVYFFETAANVFTRIKKEGFVAVWDMIKEKASNLFDSVIDQARDWVVKTIVKVGLAHVAALATPIGDAIEIIKTIYETIKFFIEKASKFVELVDSVVNAFSDMVEGKIEGAAKKIEDTMANSIPLILKFLADLFGLSGIGESIRKIITAIRKPIDDAIGKVLDFIVEKAKPLWEKGKEAFLGGLANIKEWWKKPKKFKYGEEDHELLVEGEGDHPQVFVQSSKNPLEQFLKDVHATPKQTKDILKLAGQLNWRQGELQKPADDEKGSKTYDKLRDELDHLKAREAPKSEVKYMDTDSLGGGLEADAYLTSNREVGTEPQGDANNANANPPIWNDLGYLRQQKFYVRGHLLSMRLGGQGIWKNMMPITNTVNGRMNAQLENHLKKATAPNSNRYFHYNILAKYDNSVVLPPVDDKQRPVEAEKRLISLSWTVKPAKSKDGGGLEEDAGGKLLDADGKAMPATVAAGNFTPPTVR